MFCFHKYNKPEDGYQSCSKCGKTRRVKCSHKWRVVHKITIYDEFDIPGRDVPAGHRYVLQCERCGNMKRKKQ